jgi:hypothetical protein
MGKIQLRVSNKLGIAYSGNRRFHVKLKVRIKGCVFYDSTAFEAAEEQERMASTRSLPVSRM